MNAFKFKTVSSTINVKTGTLKVTKMFSGKIEFLDGDYGHIKLYKTAEGVFLQPEGCVLKRVSVSIIKYIQDIVCGWDSIPGYDEFFDVVYNNLAYE